MNIEEAIDVLKELEEIYGSPNPFKDDKDYDRAVAIKTVLNELDKDNNIISDLQNEVTLKQCELDKKDKHLSFYEKNESYKANIIELKDELDKKDKIINEIIKRLDNDIKRITETKADGYTDDYRRCRLKAYRTKTKEIKEYIEKQYFTKKVSKK